MHDVSSMKAAVALVATLLVASAFFPQAPADAPGRAAARADEDLLEWVNPTPTGSSLTSVAWPASSSFALMSGNAGTVLRFEPFGTPRFSLLQPGVTDDLNAIAFRPGGSTALMVGDLGTVLLYDGGTFQALASGTQKNLNDVAWAPDGSVALVLGDDGTLLAYDGSSLARLNTTTALDLHAGAWAPGNDFALLVGEKGLACRANLTAFEVVPTGVQNTDLNDVDYRPGSFATAVGNGGNVLRYDGQTFSADRTAVSQNFNAVAWRPDGSSAIVVGLDQSDLNHTQASAYILSETNLVKVPNNITDRMLGVVWEPGTTMALIVGSNGLVAEYSAGSIDLLSAAVAQNMLSVGWRPDGSYALVAGAKGYLARFDGTTLAPVQTNEVTDLSAVAWHPAMDYALICGGGGIVLRYTHSNSSVERLATGLEGTISYTSASWKPDGSCALLAGESGKIVRYDGSAFVLQQTPNPLFQVNFWDIAWTPSGAYALIAGVSGNILRYEERPLPAPLDFCVTRAAGAPGVSFFSVSWLPDPARTEALVSGTNGAVYRYNETGAVPCTTDTRRALYALAWMPKSEYALAVGEGGKLLEFVGYGFIHPASGTDAVFRDIAWRPDGSFALIAGYSGALLKFTMAKRSSPRAIISSPRQNSVYEPGSSIPFDGSNSTPTFGQGLSFQWLSNLTGPIGDGARLAKVLGAGRHRVTLFANDTSGHSGQASVDILVKAPNRAPVARIDSPSDGGTYNNTDDILFDASRSSDPDGDPLRYHWTSSRSGHLGSAPSFSARLAIGSHVITVWLNDSMGYNVSRSVTVNVVPFNQAPVPVIGSPRANGDYNDSTPVPFDATASSDGDGDVLDYFWTSNVSGYLGGSSRFTRSLPAGAHAITLWVDDGRGGNRSASVNITVKRANSAPSVTVDYPLDGAILKGTVVLSGVAIDPEGTALTVLVQVDEYDWDQAGGGASWNYTLDTTRFANGRHTIRIKASDGMDESNITARSVTVANPGWGWTVTVGFPLDGTSVKGKVTIEGTASRMGSHIAQVEIRIDGGDWAVAGGTAQWSSVWDSTKVKNGIHTVTVRAFDGTDYSPEVAISLVVDNPAVASGQSPILLYGAIAIAIIALVGVAAFLMMRRPAIEPGTPKGNEEEE